jgi:hypothetical protein
MKDNEESGGVFKFLSPQAAATVSAYHLFGWPRAKLKEELGSEWQFYLDYLEWYSTQENGELSSFLGEK